MDSIGLSDVTRTIEICLDRYSAKYRGKLPKRIHLFVNENMKVDVWDEFQEIPIKVINMKSVSKPYITLTGNKSIMSLRCERYELDLNNSSNSTACASHNWKTYEGLLEKYDYCTTCDEKKKFVKD